MKKIIVPIVLAALFAVLFTSCSKDDSSENLPFNNPKTYVIVPGAWQAPYAWAAVKANLEKEGNKVIVVELPGHGADQTAPQTITMDLYRDKVISAINSVNGKVVLVGHSLGGVVISEVAEKVPAKIEKLIYIAAFLPVSGQTLFQIASTDQNSLLGMSLSPSSDGFSLELPREKLADIFIQDGTSDAKNLVLNNYRSEPGRPFNDTVKLTQANYGSVPKYYIHTLQDHAVTYSLQQRMLAATPVQAEFQLNTSHSPFLSKPDSVAILFKKISK